VTLADLAWYVPLAVAVSLVLGASGRDGVRTVAKATASTFVTLACVVGGVGLVIRLVVVFFT
jgi:hypothetical protein